MVSMKPPFHATAMGCAPFSLWRNPDIATFPRYVGEKLTDKACSIVTSNGEIGDLAPQPAILKLNSRG
jgi:hypothetical protein